MQAAKRRRRGKERKLRMKTNENRKRNPEREDRRKTESLREKTEETECGGFSKSGKYETLEEDREREGN